MRVLHVIGGLDPRSGGTTTALAGMVRAQKAAGLEVQVLTVCRRDTDTRVIDSLKTEGIPVELIGPVNNPWGRHAATRITLANILGGVHVVHLHGLWEHITQAAGRAAIRKRIKLVVTPHGMLDRQLFIDQPLVKKIKKVAYYAIFLRPLFRRGSCHFTAPDEATSCILRLETKKRFVEPLGIDLGWLDEYNKADSPVNWPPVDPDSLVVFLGRIHEIKGCDLLIKAIGQVANSEINLALVGPIDPEYRRHLQALAEASGVSARVHWVGPVYGEQRKWVFQNAAMFVLPSRHESFGLAIFEAVAGGLPVLISKNVKSFRWFIDSGVGVLAEREPDAIAEGIQHILADRKMRCFVRAQGYDLVSKSFNWLKIGSNWIRHYEQMP